MKKQSKEKVIKWILGVLTAFVLLSLSSIIMMIFLKGYKALSWEIISQVPKGGYYFGKSGGILNAIIGSVYLAIGAGLLALAISIPSVLYMHTFLFSKPKLQEKIRLVLDVLWGIPPIVYGAFVFNIMLFFSMPSSLFAAILTVSLLISPVMIRAMDESLQLLPKELYESAISLGFYRAEIGFKFLLKQSIPACVSAFLLALGKGIGDTASVLFTSGYTDYIPESLTEPAATLPLSIFFQLSSPIEEVKARAYAAALVLMLMVLFISVISRILSAKLSKNNLKI
jgi:phosphate transport system permease protein